MHITLILPIIFFIYFVICSTQSFLLKTSRHWMAWPRPTHSLL